MAQQDKVNIWIPFSAIILLFFINNWAIPLWNADEAAYAGISLEMLRSGDFLNQDFFWSNIHRKPPLHFWITALSMTIFGVNEWAVRFFSSVFILISGWYIFIWVTHLYKQEIGVICALIFCTNFLCLVLGKIAFTDATLMVAYIIGGISLYNVHSGQRSSLKIISFWAAIAFGLLVKGPQIIIPFGTLVLLMTVLPMDRKIILKLKPWFYLPLSLVPLFIWGYFSWQTDDGEFVKWLLDWYILRRAEGVLGQTGPPGYYLVVLIAVFLFYFVGFWGVLRKIVRRNFKLRSIEGFLILWALSAWLPYEFIPSKLPHYIAGAIPPLSILTGLSLYFIDERTWKSTWLRFGVFLQFVLWGIVASVMVYVIQEQFGFYGLFITILTALVPIISLVIYVIQIERQKFRPAFRSLSWGAIIFGVMMFLPLMNVMMPIWDCPRKMGKAAGFEMKDGDKILLAKREVHMISIPFYLRKNGPVREVWSNEEAQTHIDNDDFKIVVGDSVLSHSLKESYSSKRFRCFDINDQSYKDFYLMTKR
ncbi:MAG: glycosyltransferase family 39 protein [Saprospiraceae bacterium]|nr:glycosyltransferase family 39 protein [Saprospiraceae bacterium]